MCMRNALLPGRLTPLRVSEMVECCVQDRGLLWCGDTERFKPASTSGPVLGRRLGSEGTSGQPQDTSTNPAPLSALSTFPAINTTSSGSQGSVSLTRSRGCYDSTAGARPHQRSSKRLAAKRAQRDTQDTSPSSRAAQHRPEAQLRLSDILGLPLSGHQQDAPALPKRHSGQLGADLGAEQPLQEGNLLQSSCKGLSPCATQAADMLTLDQALESMNPHQNSPLGLQNPFEAAAGDSPWHIPSRAEGSQGVDGRASPCSTLTGHQDQLAWRSLAQVCLCPFKRTHLNAENEEGLSRPMSKLLLLGVLQSSFGEALQHFIACWPHPC